MFKMPTTRLQLFDSDGRLATLPVRVMALAMYISILLVEQIFWNLGWCGDEYRTDWMIYVVVALGIFVLLEWTEQRYWLAKPALGLAVGAIGVRIILTEFAGRYGCSGFHTFFAFVPPLLAYLYIGYRAALITAGISIALYIVWLATDGSINVDFLEDENVVVEFFIMAVGMVLMLFLGRTLVLEEKNRHRAEQLLTELEKSQQQVAELAKVEERNRIARDIHDSVGHHLMAATVQLEKAKAYREINPAEADKALDDAKRSAQSALADVRESVSTLRSEDGQFELKRALRELVARFNQIPVSLTIEGGEEPFAKPVLMALYRAAQEGLTNVEKHASATAIKLAVSLTTDYAQMTLSDNGSGFPMAQLNEKMAKSEAHFGLTGLRERVELQGGTVKIESRASGSANSASTRESGTTILIHIPAKGLER